MRENYFKDGEYWVSPYNFVPEVRKSFELPPKVQIHDATLRDGEQTPGIVFSVDDKVKIAQALNDVGIERIEAGMPAVSPQDQEAIKIISKMGLKSQIFTFARAMKADIDMALECGAKGVIIEVPIGYPKLTTQFKWTWKDVLEEDGSDHQLRQGKRSLRRVLPVRHDARTSGGSGKPLQGNHGRSAAGFHRHRRHDGLRNARSNQVHGALGQEDDRPEDRNPHAQRFRHGRRHRTRGRYRRRGSRSFAAPTALASAPAMRRWKS